MSSLTATELAASQYALLTSLCAFPGSLLAGSSGFIIAHTGFTMFFVATSLIGIPVALLCWYVVRLHANVTARPGAPRTDRIAARRQKSRSAATFCGLFQTLGVTVAKAPHRASSA